MTQREERHGKAARLGDVGGGRGRLREESRRCRIAKPAGERARAQRGDRAHRRGVARPGEALHECQRARFVPLRLLEVSRLVEEEAVVRGDRVSARVEGRRGYDKVDHLVRGVRLGSGEPRGEFLKGRDDVARPVAGRPSSLGAFESI